MRTSPLLPFVALFSSASALVAAAACVTTPAVTVVHVPPGQTPESSAGDPVKIHRGSQEAFAGVKSGFFVVRSVDDWRAVWPPGKDPPLPPTLDVTRSMLLVAVDDVKDATRLQVQRIVDTGEIVDVYVKETKSGQGCVAKPDHGPFDAVIADRIDKPVRFVVEEEPGESCGEPPTAAVECRVGDAPHWAPKIAAQPGDTVECTMTAQARGKFELVDRVISLRDLPGGSAAKLAFPGDSTRGSFVLDVFGTYTVRAEAADEAGRRGAATATVESLPPKSKDVLLQVVWANFDRQDDPDTFPRVRLHAIDEGPKGSKPVDCSSDAQAPFCTVKTHSAYTLMTIKASDKKLPIVLKYLDERVDKGPLVCVQAYFDGARTAETCDRKHRDAEEEWHLGTLDVATGKLAEPGEGDAGAPSPADAAAPSAADAGARAPADGGKRR